MNPKSINRRDWLKVGALASAAFTLGLKADNTDNSTYVNPLTGEWVGDFPIDAPLRAKLNANENPYGQSAQAMAAFQAELKNANRYGSPLSREFTSFMAEQHSVQAENVILSAGSLELLQLSALAFGKRDANIISVFPTFEPMMRNAQAIGCNWRQVEVDLDLKHNLESMEQSIDAKTRLVYICNPNNPTGTILDPDELREFCKRVSRRVAVFVDEAYNDFLDDPEKHSMVDLVREGHNVIVCKTFSKVHGFAGLRVGYAIGQADLVKHMKRYRNFQTTLTRPSMKAAMASFADKTFQKDCVAKNHRAREFTYNELVKRGHRPIKSHTSFMVFPIKMQGSEFIQKMADEGVGIRSWEFQDRQWCRVSIGTFDEMKIFLGALDKVS